MNRHWYLALAVALPLAGTGAATAAKIPAKEAASFGTLRALPPDVAQARSLAWLKSVGKADPATLKAFGAVWAKTDRGVLDRVADTLALGDAEAARLLAEARNPNSAAPTAVPAAIKDAKRAAFYRGNLGLAYARALSERRVFEEALDVLRAVKPEHVADPAAYFFHRAVAEHAMLLKPDAMRSIVGLTEDVADAPRRYKAVATLLVEDMDSWKAKDLGEIARKMDNIERRLALSRGGPKTQRMQRDVVARLDELIKELENQCNGSCSGNGGACPNGSKPGGGARPSSPMPDSNIAKNSGPGNVEQKRLKGLAQQWGKLPEKERAKAMQDLIRDMPPRHREFIENYFRKLAQNQTATQP